MRIDLKTESDEVIVDGEQEELVASASKLRQASPNGEGEGASRGRWINAASSRAHR